MRPLAVVILAAGKGTRMKSALAKVLHEVCGKPLIYYPVRLARQMKAARIVAIVGHQAEAVRAAVRTEFPAASIDFALQRTQDGTGHAVLQAKSALRGFDGDVLILSGDVPLLRLETARAIVAQHRRTKSDLTSMTTRLDDPTGYGRCLTDEAGRLVRVVEQKDADEEQKKIQVVNAGFYVADAKTLWAALARIGKNNAQGEMYLTDAIEIAGRLGKKVLPFRLAEPWQILGVNSRAELAEAARIMRRAINAEWMKSGVTMIDPESTYLDWDVRVGPDTVIEPGAMLLGRTRIGAGSRIGQGARLTDVTAGPGAVLGPYVVLQGMRVEAGEVID